MTLVSPSVPILTFSFALSPSASRYGGTSTACSRIRGDDAISEISPGIVTIIGAFVMVSNLCLLSAPGFPLRQSNTLPGLKIQSPCPDYAALTIQICADLQGPIHGNVRGE